MPRPGGQRPLRPFQCPAPVPVGPHPATGRALTVWLALPSVSVSRLPSPLRLSRGLGTCRSLRLLRGLGTWRSLCPRASAPDHRGQGRPW